MAAVLGDGLKGLVPVLLAKALIGGVGLAWLAAPVGVSAAASGGYAASARWLLLVPQAAVLGCVVGHNYSVWMALIEHRFSRTGKGLATGAAPFRHGSPSMSLERCSVSSTSPSSPAALVLAGRALEVAAAVGLPVTAIGLRSPDWPFALLMGVLVYSAHHKRFVGLLKGQEPRLYINDRMGPRG